MNQTGGLTEQRIQNQTPSQDNAQISVNVTGADLQVDHSYYINNEQNEYIEEDTASRIAQKEMILRQQQDAQEDQQRQAEIQRL